jgi:pimeloyl-ACP methyl ester carboxylesterase
MPRPSSTSAPGQWLGPDPRSSSTQSLLPDTSLDNLSTPHGDFLGRRKLLIIYIHGFLGNDQSFRSFPAHVHALLANLLADSHVIHSKIYPRYKTYRSVDVARDNFSEWLRPHESPTTDVILVGHSMGGILAADVVLMVLNIYSLLYTRILLKPNYSPTQIRKALIL